MNHCVPDFEIEMDDDEYPILFSSGFHLPKKPFAAEDGIMELFWQNGPVVVQSQNQRSLRRPPPARHADDGIPSGPSTAGEIENRHSQQVENIHNQHGFMQEDEMASWLHNPIVDDSPLDHNFCADLCYSPPTINNNSNQISNSTIHTNVRTSQVTELRQPSSSVAPLPPILPSKRPDTIHDSVHFSKLNAGVEPGPSSSKNAARESTVVDSCDTPAAAAAAAAAASGFSETVRSSAEPTEGDACRGSMSTTGVAAPSTTTAGGWTGEREAMTCEMSSPGGSSGSAEPADKSTAEDRKRKGREADDSECHSEDVYDESAEARKQIRRSKSTKRSRAAEVHNLSERRRRDRINEKMRALQELIPRCNKSDKASMLDEAIEYLKSLQLQVQMMSMGCGMVPMMYPGMQQYMAAMGMGMGMEMGMNRPAVMSFPNMLATASAMPAATAAAHLGPRFAVPSFHMPHVVAPDLSRIQPVNQSDNMHTAPAASDPTQSRTPNLTDSYHQYLGPHQMHLQLIMRNQTMMQQNASKPSTSRGHENPENHQSENR